MKRLASTTILSFIAGVGLFVGTPQIVAHASEAVVQATSSKVITSYTKVFNTVPPSSYFYDDGKYRGYLALEDWYQKNSTQWVGIYSGTVYYPYVPISSIGE